MGLVQMSDPYGEMFSQAAAHLGDPSGFHFCEMICFEKQRTVSHRRRRHKGWTPYGFLALMNPALPFHSVYNGNAPSRVKV